MTNSDVADLLKSASRLMELHQENEFKIRAFNNAAFAIDRLEDNALELSVQDLLNIKGIGKGIISKLEEIKSTGHLSELTELYDRTPLGVVELLSIKGLGPKKVSVIWKDLGIESPGELLYACNENRLLSMKGFGEKTQLQVKQSLEFAFKNKGKFHYAAIETIAEELFEKLKQINPTSSVEFVGEYRRKCEIISSLEILIDNPDQSNDYIELLKKTPTIESESIEMIDSTISAKMNNGLCIKINLCESTNFANSLLELTGNEKHLEFLKGIGYERTNTQTNEEDIYQSLKLPFIIPELREGLIEHQILNTGISPDVIQYSDLRGVLHNHSTYSDGIHTLEQMADRCKQMGFEYFGICDHSKTAVYAGGLTEESVAKQHREIESLNQKMNPFKIFKGIESDILADGSLDYDETILQSFDLVVASIHSGFKMDEQRATDRIIKAVSNPYTTILGHPTGRLLLSREGYPISHKEVIDACAHYQVAIELNAHPYRLDMDWRWIEYAMEKNVFISINPDAHELDGILDMQYGVHVARKGALTKKHCLNALTLSEFESFLHRKRK